MKYEKLCGGVENHCEKNQVKAHNKWNVSVVDVEGVLTSQFHRNLIDDIFDQVQALLEESPQQQQRSGIMTQVGSPPALPGSQKQN